MWVVYPTILPMNTDLAEVSSSSLSLISTHCQVVECLTKLD